MGCGSSASAPAANAPTAVKYSEPKKKVDKPAEAAAAPAAPEAAAEPTQAPTSSDAGAPDTNQNQDSSTSTPPEDNGAEARKSRRMSAKSRIAQKCPPGWVEAAVAYCACLERGDEWPSTEDESEISAAVGPEFEEARLTFESFDVDHDRHVDIEELAKAMERLGE